MPDTERDKLKRARSMCHGWLDQLSPNNADDNYHLRFGDHDLGDLEASYMGWENQLFDIEMEMLNKKLIEKENLSPSIMERLDTGESANQRQFRALRAAREEKIIVVNVRVLSGNTYSFTMRGRDTIGDLKYKIMETGVAGEDPGEEEEDEASKKAKRDKHLRPLKLYKKVEPDSKQHKPKPLNNTWTLLKSGVVTGETLHLAVDKKGGGGKRRTKRRTKAGKKSRKQRKRKTRKCSKRKRRRTRSRR